MTLNWLFERQTPAFFREELHRLESRGSLYKERGQDFGRNEQDFSKTLREAVSMKACIWKTSEIALYYQQPSFHRPECPHARPSCPAALPRAWRRSICAESLARSCSTPGLQEMQVFRCRNSGQRAAVGLFLTKGKGWEKNAAKSPKLHPIYRQRIEKNHFHRLWRPTEVSNCVSNRTKTNSRSFCGSRMS